MGYKAERMTKVYTAPVSEGLQEAEVFVLVDLGIIGYLWNMKAKTKLLFVCLGNICRSPAAEGILKNMAKERGLDNEIEVDSAGTYGGHAGELPDRRMRVHAANRGYQLTHRSRPVKVSDFDDFDLIIAMDDNNYQTLRRLCPDVENMDKIVRMRDFIHNFHRYDYVPDPYYEGSEGFELVLDMLEEGCKYLLDRIENKE